MNYYNEFDPKAAAWLRQLISNGNIPDGDVDTRSITEVSPSDLAGYTQYHFFAGIGGWSYALQLANWDSARPVWTGSCPCQPFSSAGKGLGAADDRHLWPAFFNLIKECRPQYVFGEQVASAIGHGWLDGVSPDLGEEGYACGSAVLGAHSVGAPHIRQRLYWMAYNPSERLEGSTGQKLQRNSGGFAWHGETSGGLAAANDTGPQGRGRSELPECSDERAVGTSSNIGWVGNTNGERCNREPVLLRQETTGRDEGAHLQAARSCADGWSNHTLIPCRDGKQRRIESGTFPLVNGLPEGMVYSGDPSEPFDAQATSEARVMRLKGYGNAIVPQTAAAFIQASVETIDSFAFT